MVDCALRKRPHRCPFGSARILEHAANGIQPFPSFLASKSAGPDHQRTTEMTPSQQRHEEGQPQRKNEGDSPTGTY